MTVLASTDPVDRPGRRSIVQATYHNYMGADPQERVHEELLSAGIRIKVRDLPDGETRVDVFPNSKVDNPNGRRIYIHENSFLSLAAQSEENAKLIYGSLMRVSAIKTAHHHLKDVVDLGIFPDDAGQHVVESLEAEAKGHLTSMMQQIGYRSPDNSSDFFPLLEPDEQIEASCFESGYFTYATGDEAGRVMFAEQGSLAEQRKAMREGRGAQDLTMTKGQLGLIDPDVGTGLSIAENYFPLGASATQMNPEDLERVKNTVRAEVLGDVAETVRDSFAWDTKNGDHVVVLRGLFAACVTSLTSGIFKDGTESDDPRTKSAERRNISEQIIVNFRTIS